MTDMSLLFFDAFLTALWPLEQQATSQFRIAQSAFISELKELDPAASNKLAKEKLSVLNPDLELLTFYDSLTSYLNASFGDGIPFTKDAEFVVSTSKIAIRLSGMEIVPIAFVPTFSAAIERALVERSMIKLINSLIRKIAQALNEYRLQLLEERPILSNKKPNGRKGRAPLGGITRTLQARALSYVFEYAFGVSQVDATNIYYASHLISREEIPDTDGEENIDRSPFKGAFREMTAMSPEYQLKENKLILDTFLPLKGKINSANSEVPEGLQRMLIAVQNRIDELTRIIDDK